MTKGFAMGFLAVAIGLSAFVAAIWIYTNAENNDYKKIMAELADLTVEIDELSKTVLDIPNYVEMTNKFCTSITDAVSILKLKTDANELELRNLKVHKEPVKAQVLNVNWVKPLPVEVISRRVVKSKK